MGIKRLKKITKRRIKFIWNPIRDFLRNKDIKSRAKYSSYYSKLSVNEKHVLYESRDGKSMTDNPYAIFKHLLHHEKGENLTHIWSLSDKKYLRAMKDKYRNYPNVKFVLRNSKAYLVNLATCKYLFNNSTFQNLFTIKDEQVYINTWHGTPLKHMGNDIEGQPMGSSNVVRNFLSTDFILSPNQFTTEIFNNSFKLQGLYNGEILEEGYPRIDLTINADKDEVKNTLRKENVDIDDRKLILYAPTWKGDRISNPRNDVEQIYSDISMLNESLGNEYQVIVKVHPFLYNLAQSSLELKGKLVPDIFETNELLSITDILITDYSSIFFDFLVTNKPMLFYMLDYADYNNSRGMYIEPNELPGPISTDVKNLIHNIKSIEKVEKDYKEVYQSYVKKFCYHDYGNVTESIVQKVFNQSSEKKESSANSLNESFPKNPKEKILIYPGGLRNNGITGAMLSLLDNIDYKKYDVSLLVNFTGNQEVLSNMLNVNENVRLIFKVGRINQTIFENYRNTLIKNRGISSELLEKIYPSKMYKKEFKRIFGKSTFDYIIDYSGYSMFWPNILLAGEAKKKIIFMHSDLYADMNRVINNRRLHYINLRGVFTLYKYFDELVSVSEATMELNKNNLKEFIGDTKISYITNSLNPKKIISMSKDTKNVYYKDGIPVLVNFVGGNNQIVDTPIPRSEEGYINFVTMGRLSPEKGQDQLIEAFSLVQKKYSNARLYILGEGPLRSMLEGSIHALGLQGSVFMTGHQSNPFYLLNKCDAFVLSSHYEGQPLVLLEALTLGLQIVATDIVANRYVLKDGEYGILSENSVEGLYSGMLKVIEEDPIKVEFDVDKYNQEAMDSFYQKIND